MSDEDRIEAAARALASMEPGEDWPTNEALGGSMTGTRDDEYRDGMRERAKDALDAADYADGERNIHRVRVDDDAVERMARAIHGQYRLTDPNIHRSNWDEIHHAARAQWMSEATAAINALTDGAA